MVKTKAGGQWSLTPVDGIDERFEPGVIPDWIEHRIDRQLGHRRLRVSVRLLEPVHRFRLIAEGCVNEGDVVGPDRAVVRR
jgi:hypothetical protein